MFCLENTCCGTADVMLTLEEIVDLEMATDHLDAYNMSVQSKTPYSDLTQVYQLGLASHQENNSSPVF